MKKPPKVPTDLKILEAIYNLHHEDFVLYDQDEKIRKTKIYVPIDCHKVAEKLEVNGDIVFGRLYYHLNEKYHYRQENGSKVAFFAYNEIPDSPKSINFPLLTSILAGLREEKDKFLTTIIIAIVALVLSVISIVLGLYP